MYAYDEILTRNAMLQGSASTASPAGSKAIPIALARVAIPCCLLCCGGGGWGEREKSGAGAVVPLNAGLGVRRYQISATAGGGHSWSNFGSPSAIHALVRLAAQLTQLH